MTGSNHATAKTEPSKIGTALRNRVLTFWAPSRLSIDAGRKTRTVWRTGYALDPVAGDQSRDRRGVGGVFGRWASGAQPGRPARSDFCRQFAAGADRALARWICHHLRVDRDGHGDHGDGRR